MMSDSKPGWERRTLGDVLTLKRGYDLPIQDRREGSVPIVSSSGISGSHDRARVNAPGVVTGRYGTIGAVFYIDRDFWPLNTALYVENFKGNNPRYCAELLRTIDFSAYDSKSSVPGVNRNDLHAAEVLVAPQAEQERIAHVASRFDDKIDSNRRLSQLLEQIAQTEFQRRFAGHLEGAGQLGDYVEVIRGRSYKSSELVESDTALVTLKSIRRGGGYSADGLKPYAGDFKPEQVLRPSELVVAHTDLTQKGDVIGKPAVVPDRGGYSTLVASLDLAIVRPLADALSVPFLYFLMLEPAFQQHAYGFANGSTVLHLSKQAIPTFPFEMPGHASLLAYKELAEPLFAQSAALEAEARTLASIRDALLPKLIAGEIRLRDTTDAGEVVDPVVDTAV
jgi:type I restriction enzyme S subunit